MVDFLRVLRERWRIVALFVVLGVAVGVGSTALSTRMYSANVQVFVASSNASDPLNAAQGAVYAQSQVSTYAAIVTSPDVLNAVLSDLNLTMSRAQLKSELSADSPATQTLVNLHVTDRSPSRAAAIANSAARAFTSAVEKYTTPSGSTKPAVRLFITDPATEPSSPSSPNALLNIIAGFFVGLLIGLSVAALREVVDHRVKDPNALAEVADAPVMGVVVDDPSAQRFPIASRAGARNGRAENFRQLRANLQFADVDHHPRVIAITSSVPNEGKTMVAMNLASTLAEAGFTVCLVDADLRRPTVAKTLGLAGEVGLTSVLIQQVTLQDALQSAGKNFFVLASGPTPPNPSEVLASSYVREVVRSLLDTVDYVVLDTAPLLPVADGAEVAALAEGTLLVARNKLTTDTQVERSVAALSRVSARLMGVVLNGVSTKNSGDYSYGYDYYREPARRGGSAHRNSSRGIDRPAAPVEQVKVEETA